jgi:hypothetical protein
MSRADKSELRPVMSHYDANYGGFQTDLAQIHREAFGEDIGQNSTAKEAKLQGSRKKSEPSFGCCKSASRIALFVRLSARETGFGTCS